MLLPPLNPPSHPPTRHAIPLLLSLSLESSPHNKYLRSNTAAAWSVRAAIWDAPSLRRIGSCVQVVAGEYWRLLTATFMHAGLLHLGTNCGSLWAVAPEAEAVYGCACMAPLSLFSGVVRHMHLVL